MTEDEWAALAAARPKARRAAARLVGDGPDADDCVSAAIELAVTSGPLTTPEGWLVEVTRRRAVDLVRRRTAERNAWRRALARQMAGDALDFVENLADYDAARWLATEAESLPVSTRRVLERLGEGASAADIAATLGVTRRSVESHTLRARLHLRAAWARSLAAVAALLAGVRKLARPSTVGGSAALSAAVASVAVFLGGGHSAAPVSHPVAPMHAATRTANLVHQAPGAAAPRRLRPTRPVVRTIQLLRPVRQPAQPVAAVGGRTAGATVTKQQRPSPDDPIGGSVWCLQHWTVSASHIGC